MDTGWAPRFSRTMPPQWRRCQSSGQQASAGLPHLPLSGLLRGNDVAPEGVSQIFPQTVWGETPEIPTSLENAKPLWWPRPLLACSDHPKMSGVKSRMPRKPSRSWKSTWTRPSRSACPRFCPGRSPALWLPGEPRPGGAGETHQEGAWPRDWPLQVAWSPGWAASVSLPNAHPFSTTRSLPRPNSLWAPLASSGCQDFCLKVLSAATRQLFNHSGALAHAVDQMETINIFKVAHQKKKFGLQDTVILYVSLVARTVKNLPAIQETWVQSLGWEIDPLEKEMATHSSILAWKVPCTEEPAGLQSMGSQRVRYNWATKHKAPFMSKNIMSLP